MNGSEQYHQPVLEALCAFVRDRTTTVPIRQNPFAPLAPRPRLTDIEPKPATDIQAALTVIGRRAGGPGKVDLAQTKIAGATLVGANLTGANLSEADLTFADLRGANLSGADLTAADLRYAGLIGANLTGASLGADLSGADLSDTNVSQAQLDAICGTARLPPNRTLKPCPTE
jgi:hypothetical protein